MQDLISKRIKSTNVFRGFITALVIILFVFPLLSPTLIAIPMILLIVLGAIYVGTYRPFMVSLKLIKREGLEEAVNDIPLSQPSFPKSNIYCGKAAFFCKKPYTIIPYSEIAWVYIQKTITRGYGGYSEQKSLVIRTKSKRKFNLLIDMDEFPAFFQLCILPNTSDLIVGYGHEQKLKYFKTYSSIAKT